MTDLVFALRLKAEVQQAAKALDQTDKSVEKIDKSAVAASKSTAALGAAIADVGAGANGAGSAARVISTIGTQAARADAVVSALGDEVASLAASGAAAAKVVAPIAAIAPAADRAERQVDELGARLEELSTEAASPRASQGIAKIGSASAAAAPQVRAVRREVDQLGDQSDRTKRQVEGLGGAFASIKRQAAGLLAGVGLVSLGRSIIQTSDRYAQLSGRLNLVADSEAEVIRLEKELFAVAQNTRSGYGETVELFGKVAQANDQLGLSQRNLLRLTETTNKSIQIGGASAASAAAGVEQFGQALQSGVLAGDELKSIRENAPALFNAIVDGLQNVAPALNVTKANFRDLAAEGKITSDLVARALLDQADAIDERFSKLPRTVGQSVTQLTNEISRGIAEGDMSPLIESIDDLREQVADPQFQSNIASFAGAIAKLVGLAASAAAGIAGAGRNIGENFAKLAQRREMSDLSREAATLEDRIRRLTAAGGIKELFGADVQGEIAASRKRLVEVTNELARIANRGDGTEPPTLTGPEKKDDDQPPPPIARPSDPKDARKRLDAQLSAASALFKASLDRDRAALDAQLEDNLVSYADYYRQRADQDRAEIDRQIADRQKLLSGADSDDAIRIQGEIAALRVQRDASVAESAREADRARKQLADDVANLRIRLQEATGDAAGAARARLTQEFDELVKRLTVNGEAGGVEIAKKLFNVEAARIEIDKIEDALDEIQQGLERRRSEIDVAINTGALTRAQGRRELVQATQQAVEQESALADEYERQAQIIGDPELTSRVAALRTEIARTGEIGREAFNQIKGAAEQAGEEFTLELLDDIRNVDDAFENLLGNLEQSVKRLIAQRLNEQLIDSLFGGLGGGAGGGGGGSFGDSVLGQLFTKGLGFFSGLFGGGTAGTGVVTRANVQHAGGLAGTGPRRLVSALHFASAPRYHGGGLAGLGPDEVPTILKSGRDVEEVLRRDDPRHRLNGGLDRGARSGDTHLHLHGITDMGSFRRNETELAARASDILRQSQRNR